MPINFSCCSIKCFLPISLVIVFAERNVGKLMGARNDLHVSGFTGPLPFILIIT